MRTKVQAWLFSFFVVAFFFDRSFFFLSRCLQAVVCSCQCLVLGYICSLRQKRSLMPCPAKAAIQLPPFVLFNFEHGPYASHTNWHHQSCRKSAAIRHFLETVSLWRRPSLLHALLSCARYCEYEFSMLKYFHQNQNSALCSFRCNFFHKTMSTPRNFGSTLKLMLWWSPLVI